MTTKNYIALARVSSPAQEHEGCSLDVQEDAIRRHVECQGGTIVRLWRIAKTASKTEKRQAFNELVEFAKSHANELAGIVCYSLGSATRNLHDFMELERLESEYGLQLVFVSQQTHDLPAGRLLRRSLASLVTSRSNRRSSAAKASGQLTRKVRHRDNPTPTDRQPGASC